MTIRDLPKIIRIMDNAAEAHVIIVHGEDVISFNISDVAGTIPLARAMLHRIYIARGANAIQARRAKRRVYWLFLKRWRTGFLAMTARIRWLSSWRPGPSLAFSSWWPLWRR
jgi:hypothetical protein